MELIDVLRGALTEPRTMAELKEITKVHDVALTIALRNLHLSGEAACGFVSHDGEWLDSGVSCCDEGFYVAWHIPEQKRCGCGMRTEVYCTQVGCEVDPETVLF